MRGLGTIFALFLVALVGIAGYQIGLMQQVAPVAAPGVAPVAYYWHPFGFGFGFLGLLFPLFFLFLFFGLVRAAMGGGGHGMWRDRRTRLEELHRELHEKQSGTDARPT